MKLIATDFIPHQFPMVFIDEVIEINDEYAIAQLTVRPELMFCNEQGLPTWAAIELMAQTISMYAGIQGQRQGLEPKIGFLLGTRKMLLPIAYFALNSQIQIKVKKNYMHDNLGVFDCELYYDQHIISATLSVYEPENVLAIDQHI